MGTTAQPFLPDPCPLIPQASERVSIARNAVVRLMAPQLGTEGLMLPGHGLVAMPPTPLGSSLQRPPTAARRRLALHHPASLPRFVPVVGQPQKRKAGRRRVSLRL